MIPTNAGGAPCSRIGSPPALFVALERMALRPGTVITVHSTATLSPSAQGNILVRRSLCCCCWPHCRCAPKARRTRSPRPYCSVRLFSPRCSPALSYRRYTCSSGGRGSVWWCWCSALRFASRACGSAHNRAATMTWSSCNCCWAAQVCCSSCSVHSCGQGPDRFHRNSRSSAIPWLGLVPTAELRPHGQDSGTP